MHVRLQGTFTLRAPLSHIGEAISTNSYLVQEPILQPDHSVEEVFCYSGNAWRGQLRDLAAMYLLGALGGEDPAKAPLDPFHLLFSGGRIGGDQVIDVNAARRMREAVPPLALFGGGVGNQILGGQLNVSNAYPVCKEALRALPADMGHKAGQVSYRSLTFEKSFTRRDDTKHDRQRKYLCEGEGGEEDRQKDGPADQMRTTSELMVAGSELYTEIECVDVDEVRLGALVSALSFFGRNPHIGGQVGRGHGRVDLSYGMRDMDSGEEHGFLRIQDGGAELSERARAAKEAYDRHIEEHADDIAEMLEIAACG